MAIKNFVSEHIQKLNPYKVNKIDYKIKMDDNSSPYNLPDTIKNHVINNIKKIEFNRYPDSSHSKLKNILAEITGFSKECISFGNGSDEIIQYLIQMFCNKHDLILNVTPSFAMFQVIPAVLNIKLLEIPLIETENNWELDFSKVMNNLEKTKIIFLANPNNPTGTVFNKNQILEIIKSKKCIVVIDEAYYDYESFTYAELLKDYDNLIIMRSFSKTLGLAGCRLGYLISNKNIIDIYNSVRLPYNINSLSLVTAETVLDNLEIIKENFVKLFSEKNRIYNKLIKLPKLKVYKSGANFILLKTEYAEQVYNKILKNKGILLKYFSKGRLKNCLRITVGTVEQNNILIDFFENFFKE
jgi:histidinol-phosphate aminotransferase